MKLPPDKLLVKVHGCLHQVEITMKAEIDLNHHIINIADKRYKKNRNIVSILWLRNQRYEHILNFIRLVRRGNIDKRFLDLMFGCDLTSFVDTSKLTREICNLVATSRKLYPKKRTGVFPR